MRHSLNSARNIYLTMDKEWRYLLGNCYSHIYRRPARGWRVGDAEYMLC